MSTENDKTLSDVLSQAKSMETMLMSCIEKLEETLAKSIDQFQNGSGESFIQGNSPDLFCQSDELEEKLMKISNRLHKFALHDPSDLDGECSSGKGDSAYVVMAPVIQGSAPAAPGDQPSFEDLLWDGSERGDALLVQRMIHLGVDLLQVRDPKTFTSTLDGYDVQYKEETCLHKASRGGHLEVVRLLLDAGVDVELRNEIKLHNIVDKSVIHIHGAGVEEANGMYKISALHGESQRAEYRHSNSANTRNSIQWSIYSFQWILDQPGPGLYRIAGNKSLDFPFDGEWSTYQEKVLPVPFTNASASMHSPVISDYATALHIAAENGHLGVVQLLISQGRAHVDAVDAFQNFTPLMMAAAAGHAEVVRFLISEANANVEAKDSKDQTALIKAAAAGQREVVHVLTNVGNANIKAVDGFKQDALLVSAANGHKEVVLYLLLEANSNVETTDCDESTPLIRASRNGHIDVVRLLIQEGKANIDARDIFGSNSFLSASENGHAEVARLLCFEAEADTSQTDNNGMSAVDHAVQKGNMCCALVLWGLGCRYRPSDLTILHTKLQRSGIFGGNSKFLWTSIKGNVQMLPEGIRDKWIHDSGLLLVYSVSHSHRYLLLESVASFLESQQVEHGISPLTLIAKFDGSGTIMVETAELDSHIQCQSEALIILLPPKSDTLLLMPFCRLQNACSDKEIDTATQLLADGPWNVSVDLKDDQLNCILTNSVQALQFFNMSFLDISYLGSLIELQLDSLYSLDHLTEVVCRYCPNLCKVFTAMPSRINFRKSQIQKFDFSDNDVLEALPLDSFSDTQSLKELLCTGCPVLYYPPKEICKQGGKVTVDFLREVKRDGHQSKHMTLFLIGDGESGKTSVIKALMSQKDVAERIQEDKRTVGIDISEWAPENADVTFKIFDLAGQAVYGKTHQLFLQRRAVYMLVWRAHYSLLFEQSSLNKRILHWMDSLQHRIPGAYLIIVVTHIDAVAEDVLTELCQRVKKSVYNRLKSMASSSKQGMPVVHVCDGGESIRVNCLEGLGISGLRRKIVAFTESMPWYKERLPSSWENTKQAILERSNKGERFLEWSDFESLAATFGLKGKMLAVATKFLHETGIVRYFGDLKMCSIPEVLNDKAKERIQHEIRRFRKHPFSFEDVKKAVSECFDGVNMANAEQYQTLISKTSFDEAVIGLISLDIASSSQARCPEYFSDKASASREMLQNTVFISPHFMINVMKGLIRHDRDALLAFFMHEGNKIMMRRVNRLSATGRLHLDLIPFLWPSCKGCENYWKWVKNSEEGDLWPFNVISSDSDLDKAVALLEGFDLLALNTKEKEIVVPGIVSDSRTWLSSDAFNAVECPFYTKYTYLALPDGSFESIIVRLAKTASHIQYSADAAVFYKFGHMGQVFCSVDSTSRVHLCLKSSSRKQLISMQSEVLRMEDFFPGLVRIGHEISPEKDETVEPSLIIILSDQTEVATRMRKELCETANNDALTVAIQLPSDQCYESILDLSAKEEEDFEYHISRLGRRFLNGPVKPDTLRAALLQLKFSATEHEIEALLSGSMAEDFSSTLMALATKLTFKAKLLKYKESMKVSRVVLVCMTDSVSTCKVTCAEFDAHIQAGRAIIPLIMEGFKISDYSCWWPNSMPGFEDHKLFTDLRISLTEDRIQKVQSEVLPQVYKFLEEWRARPDSNTVHFHNYGTPKAAEIIECLECIKSGIDPAEIMCFNRQDIKKQFDAYLIAKNQGIKTGHSVITCGVCKFNHNLHDLLTTSRISEAVPCSLCLTKGKYPPGAFSLQYCRLQFNESDRQRMGTVVCSTCGGHVRIMDVAPPEVFTSYNWGVKVDGMRFEYSSQNLVIPMLQSIELHADVACWVDIEGGMGAGQDHLQEMRRGVESANIVLIFLSDCYVNSNNCIREFLAGVRACKYLIPILIPASGQSSNGFSVGWSGPGPEDPHWWMHAAQISGIEHDPDHLDLAIDWSYLGMYAPICLKSHDAAVEEIVRRIMSRLHRSAKLNTNTLAAQKKMVTTLTWRHLAHIIQTKLSQSDLSFGSNEGRMLEPGVPEGQVAQPPIADEVQESRIRAAFDLLDTDGSGKLEVLELKSALQILGMRSDDAGIKRLLDLADRDRSGTLDIAEFSTLMTNAKPQTEQLAGEPIQRIFHRFVDGDETGCITFNSLRRVSSQLESDLGRSLTEADVQAMIRVACPDDSGCVTLENFEHIMAITSFRLC